MLRCLSCFNRRAPDDTTEDSSLAASGILGIGHHDNKSATFEDTYDTLYQIGEGKTGQVFVARKKRPHYRSRAKTLAEEQQRERESRECDEEVAVKFVRQEYLSTPNRIEALQAELAILARVKHPGVLRLRQVFQDDDKFAIVTDKAMGGEVMDALCRPGAPRVRECDVAEVVRQLLSVLAYLHLNGITHRDVKVENILCKTKDLRDGVLLIDFGLAHVGTVGGMRDVRYERDAALHGARDVPQERLLRLGYRPLVEDKIVKGEFEYPAELEHTVSHQAKKFIEYLLVLNPRERPPAAMALQHPWLQVDSSAAEPFSDEHMAALAKFSEGKKVFVLPASTEYMPPEHVPHRG
ncbi:hypothetical protein PRNP1_004114 [Phytophthora ramorum]